jgi:hypothetical protein
MLAKSSGHLPSQRGACQVKRGEGKVKCLHQWAQAKKYELKWELWPRKCESSVTTVNQSMITVNRLWLERGVKGHNRAVTMPGRVLKSVKFIWLGIRPTGFWGGLCTQIFSEFYLFYLILYLTFSKSTSSSHSNTSTGWMWCNWLLWPNSAHVCSLSHPQLWLKCCELSISTIAVMEVRTCWTILLTVVVLHFSFLVCLYCFKSIVSLVLLSCPLLSSGLLFCTLLLFTPFLLSWFLLLFIPIR